MTTPDEKRVKLTIFLRESAVPTLTILTLKSVADEVTKTWRNWTNDMVNDDGDDTSNDLYIVGHEADIILLACDAVMGMIYQVEVPAPVIEQVIAAPLIDPDGKLLN